MPLDRIAEPPFAQAVDRACFCKAGRAPRGLHVGCGTMPTYTYWKAACCPLHQECGKKRLHLFSEISEDPCGDLRE